MNAFAEQTGALALDRAWYAREAGSAEWGAGDSARGKGGAVGRHESDSARGRGTEVNLFAPSAVAALLAIACPAERQRALRQALRELGFEWMGIVRATYLEGTVIPLSIRCESETTGWPQAYMCEKYFNVDPRMAAVHASNLPCIWDIESLRQEGAKRYESTRVEAFTAALTEAGMVSGVMFSMRGDYASDVMLVSLLSRRPGRAWITDGVAGQAMLLSLCASECHDKQAHHRGGASLVGVRDEGVSELQMRILNCLREGESDKVIADRLGLSTHNVDYHLRKLRQRYGVRNRIQLMQAAIQQGLLRSEN